MKVDGTDAAPVKAVVEELQRVRVTFREVLESYAGRIDAEIAQIEEIVRQQESAKKINGAKIRDMRDMLTVLRTMQVKADKGRRKDLKKIDGVLGDLQMLVEHW